MTLRPLTLGEALFTPGRTIGIFAFEVFNQDETVIQRGRMTVLLRADRPHNNFRTADPYKASPSRAAESCRSCCAESPQSG